MSKNNIIDGAIALIEHVSKMRQPLGKDISIVFECPTKETAKLLAAAIVFANHHDHLVNKDQEKPLDRLLDDHRFTYDAAKREARVKVYPNLHKPNTWDNVTKQMLLALKEFKTTYKLNNEAHLFHTSLDAILRIFPYEPEKTNLSSHMQLRLMQLLAQYHEPEHHEKIHWEIVDLPPHLRRTKGIPMDWNAITDYLAKQSGPSPQEVAERLKQEQLDEERRTREEETKRRETAEKTAQEEIDRARVPKPFSIEHLEVGLRHLTKPSLQVGREEAQILAHAVKTLAANLDVRDEQALRASKYEPEELETERKKIESHKCLAKMLLSDENVHAAIVSIDAPSANPKLMLGEVYEPGRHPMTPRMQEDYKRKLVKNLDYLRENEYARKLLEELAPQIPGLIFLVQAAILSRETCAQQSSKLWEEREDRTADDIIHNEPQLWGPIYIKFMDAQLGQLVGR